LYKSISALPSLDVKVSKAVLYPTSFALKFYDTLGVGSTGFNFSVSSTNTGAIAFPDGSVQTTAYLGSSTATGVTKIIAGPNVTLNPASGTGTVTISVNTGAATWSSLGNKTGASGPTTIGLGQNSSFFFQGTNAIAIGVASGYTNQGAYSVALGDQAGNDHQGNNAIAIGQQAGSNTQGYQAIAIGTAAGGGTNNIQGAYSIAIGAYSGNSGAGSSVMQAPNSIVLNATSATLNATASGLVVKPVRHVTTGSLPSGFYNMAYNPTTGEIIYWT
jgi:hypothetical protein